MAVASQNADALPRPGPIGRGVRLLLGLCALYFFVGLVAGLPKLADGLDLANPLTWLGLGYSLYAIPAIVGMVFSRRWPAQRVRGTVGGALVLAAVADLAAGGSPNGAAFGLASGLLMAGVLGILGVSFVLAAVVAAPG